MGKAKWKRNRRKHVERTERVKPPPEAAQHHRPWPMMLLLHLGPDAKGIDSDEFEAAIEIVETFKALVADRLVRPSTLERFYAVQAPLNGMSDRAAFMISVWFEWSRQIGPVATHIVEQIEDSMPIRSPNVLRMALRRWLKVKRDVLRALDRQPQTVALPNHVLLSYGRTSGDRGHALPITHPPPTTQQVTRAARTAAQATPRHVATKR